MRFGRAMKALAMSPIKALGIPDSLLKAKAIWLVSIMLPVPQSVARAPQTAKRRKRKVGPNVVSREIHPYREILIKLFHRQLLSSSGLCL